MSIKDSCAYRGTTVHEVCLFLLEYRKNPCEYTFQILSLNFCWRFLSFNKNSLFRIQLPFKIYDKPNGSFHFSYLWSTANYFWINFEVSSAFTYCFVNFYCSCRLCSRFLVFLVAVLGGLFLQSFSKSFSCRALLRI